jgi:hypothetical protein
MQVKQVVSVKRCNITKVETNKNKANFTMEAAQK